MTANVCDLHAVLDLNILFLVHDVPMHLFENRGPFVDRFRKFPGVQLYLDVNCLSGIIPLVLQSAMQVEIVDGEFCFMRFTLFMSESANAKWICVCRCLC